MTADHHNYHVTRKEPCSSAHRLAIRTWLARSRGQSPVALHTGWRCVELWRALVYDRTLWCLCHPLSSFVILCHPLSSFVILCRPLSSFVILCLWVSSVTVSIFDNCLAGSSWLLCLPWYCFKQSLARLVAALDAFKPKRKRRQMLRGTATVSGPVNWQEAKKRPPGANS